MCGLIGVVNQEHPAVNDLYLGLLALQHRGKESAALAISDQGKTDWIGGRGETPQAFWGKDFAQYQGSIGIGHVRYSTAGESHNSNIQPIEGNFHGHPFFIAHNGNLVNVNELRKQTSSDPLCSDTKVVVDLLSQSGRSDFETALREILVQLMGAFNFIILFNHQLYVVKDRCGFHPLQIGQRSGDVIVTSESCVFDLLNANFTSDVMPGEIFIIDPLKGIRRECWTKETQLRFDIFEYIYFLRPDSIVHGVEAGEARQAMGLMLGSKDSMLPLPYDTIVPVPDSGNEAGLGFFKWLAEMEFEPWASFRAHTVGRTFIEPVQEKRMEFLHFKFNPRPRRLKDKKIALIDDSVVRGNTLTVLSRLLRQTGVKEIHARISSPPYLYPDFYGIDTYRKRNELVASNFNGNISKIAQKIGVDSLKYLSLEETIDSILEVIPDNTHSPLAASTFYTGPFTGDYPEGKGDFI